MKLRLKDSFGMVPLKPGSKAASPQSSAVGLARPEDAQPIPRSEAEPPSEENFSENAAGQASLTALQHSKLQEGAAATYRVIGQPEDLEGAKELAEKDKYGFQWWILPLIGAKAFGSEAGQKEGKKGADKGIDGMMVFTDDNSGKAKRVVVSVKGGHNVSVAQIRDLGHVIDRENAAIGVFLSLDPPTKPMLTEAAEKGFYHSPGWNKDYPRLQILTVEDLLNGKTVDLPPNIDTFKKAQKIIAESDDQGNLGFE
jgi:Restriction endonuclease